MEVKALNNASRYHLNSLLFGIGCNVKLIQLWAYEEMMPGNREC